MICISSSFTVGSVHKSVKSDWFNVIGSATVDPLAFVILNVHLHFYSPKFEIVSPTAMPRRCIRITQTERSIFFSILMRIYLCASSSPCRSRMPSLDRTVFNLLLRGAHTVYCFAGLSSAQSIAIKQAMSIFRPRCPLCCIYHFRHHIYCSRCQSYRLNIPVSFQTDKSENVNIFMIIS